MVQVQFRPISEWPGKKNRSQKRSQFRATWSQTLELLDTELRNLRARSIVIEIDLPESQIRLDGWPYATAKPFYQGVIVSFEGKDGPLRFPCDRYNDWRDNLRAIALSMQALRAVDRYGVTKHGEQYTGWKQLPAHDDKDAARKAAEVFTTIGGGVVDRVLSSREYANIVYKQAAKKCHPDLHGAGKEDDFKNLQHAKVILDDYFKHACLVSNVEGNRGRNKD